MPNINRETENRKQETAALKQRIIADLTAAMKAREELKTSTLRMLKAAIMNQEVSGDKKTEATDAVVADLIRRGIKQRREAAEGFEKGGNQAMAEKELAEIKILETYLPEQMGEEELKLVVKDVIGQLGFGPSDFGRVMGIVMGKVKGKADGQLVSKVVKEVLG